MSPAYATVGTVIALLVWLHLGAQITLYAAELNVVLERGLWPRSLIGPPRVPADLETYEALAKIEERDATEHVEVSFEEPSARRRIDVLSADRSVQAGGHSPSETGSRAAKPICSRCLVTGSCAFAA